MPSTGRLFHQKKRIPPRVDGAAIDEQPANPIDAFVTARLSDQGIALAPPASPEVLARRASLVLCGLPPEPHELAVFLADPRPDAYQRYVSRLMQKPSYGEHQARAWLDAVRYGDTHGLHLDNRRGVYPYRDWVVAAINRNQPLDQFIQWQIAGDLLPSPSLEQLVASGYVRMNPTSGEGGAIAEEYQAKNNFDRTENIGAVFLGMTLTCARCHSHKYDPISQTEYYRLLAFFNSTAEPALDRNKYDYGPHIKAPANAFQWAQWELIQSQAEQLIKRAQAEPDFSSLQDFHSKWQRADLEGKLKLLAESGMSVELAAQAKQLSNAQENVAKPIHDHLGCQTVGQAAANACAAPRGIQPSRWRPSPARRGIRLGTPCGGVAKEPNRPGLLADVAPSTRLSLECWSIASGNRSLGGRL